MGKIATACGVPRDVWAMLVTYMPGHSGIRLRDRYWRKRLRRLGTGCRIDVGAWFQCPENIEIGDHCWIDRNVLIMAGESSQPRETIRRHVQDFSGTPGVVSIGNDVHVGVGCIFSGIDGGIRIGNGCGFSAGCYLYAFSHHYCSKADRARTDICFSSLVAAEQQCMVAGPIELGDNVGCALGTILLPGTQIGSHSFVQPASFVSGDCFAENSMIRGNPATRIGQRFTTADAEPEA